MLRIFRAASAWPTFLSLSLPPVPFLLQDLASCEGAEGVFRVRTFMSGPMTSAPEISLGVSYIDLQFPLLRS